MTASRLHLWRKRGMMAQASLFRKMSVSISRMWPPFVLHGESYRGPAWHAGTWVWCGVRCRAIHAVRLCVRDNSDGWLVAWGLRECMLIRSYTVWLLPFTLFIKTATLARKTNVV